MDESNCLGIHCFAEVHSCMDLMNKAKTFVLKHFQEIIEGEESWFLFDTYYNLL